MNTIEKGSFLGKKVLVRVDFNVPLNDAFEITDDTRIRAAIPTIQKIAKDGGSVILMSHLGRPKNGPEERFSLKHVAAHLATLLEMPIQFASDSVGPDARDKAANLSQGEVLLLENVRFHSEETAGDRNFAEQLAALGDCYVNDAFGTAHREHASTAVIATFFPGNKYFGYLMADELKSAEAVMHNAKKPFTAIIGGAKVSSKIGIIENLLDKLDNLIIGGGMAYTFEAAQGGNVGSSLVESDFLDVAKQVMKQAEAKGVRILLPEDSVCANGFSNDAEQRVTATNDIPENWMGLDIGPRASEHYKSCIEESKTILWNGPMGVFEFDNFESGTKKVAYAVVTATERGAFSLVGGGDSVAAVNKYSLADHVSYVSTGGGALLELIEGKKLPGVAAIES